jgi:hypothetical protein
MHIFVLRWTQTAYFIWKFVDKIMSIFEEIIFYGINRIIDLQMFEWLFHPVSSMMTQVQYRIFQDDHGVRIVHENNLHRSIHLFPTLGEVSSLHLMVHLYPSAVFTTVDFVFSRLASSLTTHRVFRHSDILVQYRLSR